MRGREVEVVAGHPHEHLHAQRDADRHLAEDVEGDEEVVPAVVQLDESLRPPDHHQQQ